MGHLRSSMTQQDLDRAVGAWAAVLRSLGVPPDDALIRVHLEEGRGTHQGRERPTPSASRSRMRTTLIKKVLDAAGPPFSASTWFFRERVVRD